MFTSMPLNPALRRHFDAGAYGQIGAQTAINAASPHALVTLLFDGFFASVHRAKGALRRGDVVERVNAIGKAVRIVDEGLKAGLNIPHGGQLAADLRDLYAYVALRLTHANLHADDAALDECLALIAPLREAWIEIAPQAAAVR